jgi:hypothetical protein
MMARQSLVQRRAPSYGLATVIGATSAAISALLARRLTIVAADERAKDCKRFALASIRFVRS